MPCLGRSLKKAHQKAIKESAKARKESESEMLEANYEVEKEKCDAVLTSLKAIA